jgi:hypothetical protein
LNALTLTYLCQCMIHWGLISSIWWMSNDNYQSVERKTIALWWSMRRKNPVDHCWP